jgi:hypothetical protein
MSVGSSRPTAAPVGSRVANPIVTIVIVMYATFAVLLVTIPQSLVNWVKDFNPSPAQDVMLSAAESIEAMSSRVGANIPYRIACEVFLRATGKNED